MKEETLKTRIIGQTDLLLKIPILFINVEIKKYLYTCVQTAGTTPRVC